MPTNDPNQKPRMISAEEFAKAWDSERSVHELIDLQVSIKGTSLYIPAKTKAAFDDDFGGPVTYVKFRTLVEAFKVWLAPCQAKEQGARRLVMLSDTQSAAQLGFAIPLRKLNVKVPDTRQFTFTLEAIPVEGGGTVYEMAFSDYKDEPRQIDEKTAAAVKQIKAEQAKAKRDQKAAERLAKLTRKGTTGSEPAKS